MMIGQYKAYIAILCSFLLAFCLSILPMPTWVVALQPNWVWLVLIFWGMAVPQCVGLSIAWLLGLMVDVLLGHLLGEHALVFMASQYLIIRYRPQIKQYSLVQQWMVVFGLLVVGYMVLFLLQGMLGQLPLYRRYWLQPLIAALCWPWLDIFLKILQNRYQIYNAAELE